MKLMDAQGKSYGKPTHMHYMVKERKTCIGFVVKDFNAVFFAAVKAAHFPALLCILHIIAGLDSHTCPKVISVAWYFQIAENCKQLFSVHCNH